mmetsp:Transcript_65221/g.172840  ORF Transcript_65221/g.172840 Transcript_65221/m.172840 type:complete len:235 (+) Transcript_65221:1107-1811(+)
MMNTTNAVNEWKLTVLMMGMVFKKALLCTISCHSCSKMGQSWADFQTRDMKIPVVKMSMCAKKDNSIMRDIHLLKVIHFFFGPPLGIACDGNTNIAAQNSHAREMMVHVKKIAKRIQKDFLVRDGKAAIPHTLQSGGSTIATAMPMTTGKQSHVKRFPAKAYLTAGPTMSPSTSPFAASLSGMSCFKILKAVLIFCLSQGTRKPRYIHVLNATRFLYEATSSNRWPFVTTSSVK